MVPAAIPTDGYGDTLTKPGEPVLPPGTDEGESAITPQEGPVDTSRWKRVTLTFEATREQV